MHFSTTRRLRNGVRARWHCAAPCPVKWLEGVGSLDSAAIDEVVRESWPVVRDADDLHDALLTLVWVPAPEVRGWQQYLPELVQSGRRRSGRSMTKNP